MSFCPQNNEFEIDTMIVGAQKCATTALLSLLGSNERIVIPSQKELVFFSRLDEFERGLDWLRWKYFSKDQDYRFQRIAKDVNLFRNEVGLTRLANTFPKVKIVTMIRNPVERVISAYLFNRQRGLEKRRSLEEVFDEELKEETVGESTAKGYLFNCDYVSHAKLIHQIFGRNRHQVIVAEDFFNAPEEIASACVAHLNLTPQSFRLEAMKTNKGGAARSDTLSSILNLIRRSPKIFRDPFRMAIGPDRAASLMSWLRERNTKSSDQSKNVNEITLERLTKHCQQVNKNLIDICKIKSSAEWLDSYK